MSTRLGDSLARGLTIAIVLALVVAGALWWTLKDAGRNHLTAYFAGAVGLYEGNSVRMLGVEMGTVTRIQPMGNQVRVELEYDRSVAVPADAKAIIVSPSLVSDRYVQLAPAYKGGPRIDDGAVIGLDRTEVPLEVDELAASLSRVSKSLGPDGANKNGSLSNLLDTAAKNFDGNGQALHDTITKLGQAAGTLSGNSGDLFKTVENLGSFSQTLVNSDKQVRDFERQLADVSGFLAGERENLAATVKQLSDTLTAVQAFIEKNRDRLKSNVDKLASVTKVLVDQRGALAEVLDVAPVGLGNLVNTYNASSGTLDARANLNELTQPPLVMVCNLLKQTPDALDALGDACKGIAGLVDGLVPLPSIAQVIQSSQAGQLPPLPLPIAGQLYGTAAK
ncbi:MCE family protein [Amycolatopsis regifaucium]|uniref:ABC transporter substrate-binding protein n=1 Tax=Amycolatopsis regifaucium TaxID=546365 RepID=A0A154MCM6_9PSEU|nr:MCE family protein [Amycolatopsis regifaucium]KZB82020.1 ABC transporter substrate-binding protein [Amycolatopsis regifaucium]OKA05906.1 ABC transporter substrate-binding protein [Amycolatopsis regifaucium]SFG79864.1 virulence factor Mce family protein [Amycolatopsis regifaucium]